jgi:integrase
VFILSLIKRLEVPLRDYKDLRTSLGYKVKNRYAVDELCEYFIMNYPDENTVTKQMFDSWLCQRTFQTNSYHEHCITDTRMFLRYLRFAGEDVFVPDGDYSVRTERFPPFIFTDEELTRLFDAIDSVMPSRRSPHREYIIPVLFRLMYCCGLRPGEPLAILKEDFNLENGELYIRQSKGYKDRRILVSNDVAQLCREYARYMKTEKYLFEREPGKRIPTDWMLYAVMADPGASLLPHIVRFAWLLAGKFVCTTVSMITMPTPGLSLRPRSKPESCAV